MAGSTVRGWRARFRQAAGVVLIVSGVMSMTSCNSGVMEGRSPVYLIVDSLAGGRGTSGDEADFFPTLQSDVLTNNSIFEDPGEVAMRVAFRDVTVTAPTTNNDVTITRYRVEYRRTDGRNRQGIDVPYAFEGASTFTVTPEGTTGGFVLVRVQSKLEQPLITLVGAGGAMVISTLADVTFYGKDQTGRDVTVTGSISVNFADWGDPES